MSRARVIWAVDPFAEDKKLQFKTYEAIKSLMEGREVFIEPVAVLSPDQLSVPKEAFKGLGKEYRLEAEKLLAGWVSELRDRRFVTPKLLLQDDFSTNASINALLDYARESNASLVAVGMHAKGKLERFLVGSFAETMMLKCDIPLLIVHPKTPIKKITHILFPTDFSNNSRDAFDRLLPMAKQLNAKISLYYKFEYLVPETVSAIQLNPNYERYLRADQEAHRRAAIQWVERATREDVKVDVILDEKPSFIAESIVKTASEQKVDLIAMASHSGAVAAALIGSVARQVVRMAEIPVWVMHRPVATEEKLNRKIEVVSGGSR